MKKIDAYDFHVDVIRNFKWFFYEEGKDGDQDGELIAVADNLEGAAEHFGVSEELLDSLNQAFEDAVGEVIDAFKQDLIDLYEKIEESK